MKTKTKTKSSISSKSTLKHNKVEQNEAYYLTMLAANNFKDSVDLYEDLLLTFKNWHIITLDLANDEMIKSYFKKGGHDSVKSKIWEAVIMSSAFSTAKPCSKYSIVKNISVYCSKLGKDINEAAINALLYIRSEINTSDEDICNIDMILENFSQESCYYRDFILEELEGFSLN